MNEPKVFENPTFGRVRTVEVDNEPWFVGKDVAEALGYSDTDKAIRNHVEAEDKLTRRFGGSGQNRNMTIINESVERGLLTNFRETAKQLGIPPRKFVNWLIEHKYLYRDKKGKLLAYENKNNGLFELKECVNERTQWAGVQTLVTPKGRETFRLLCQGLAS